MNINFNELKADLISIFGCEIIKQYGERLIKLESNVFNMSSLLSIYYIKRSQMFNLVNLTLPNKTSSSAELERKLCVSKSKLYKIRKNLNNSISELPFSFSFSGLNGDERCIRHFLVNMYWDIFGGNEWPFSEDRTALIEILETFKFEEKNFSEMEVEKSLYWLAITNMRIDAGYILIDREKNLYSNVTKLYPENNFFQRCESFFSEENRFFMDTLSMIWNVPIKNNEENNEYLTCIKKLEKIVTQKAKKMKLASFDMECLQTSLKEIRYYFQEDIICIYNFLNPSFNDAKSIDFMLLKKEVGIKLNSIPDEVIKEYYLLLKKFGIVFGKPLNVFIESKENKEFDLKKLLSNNVKCPMKYHSVNSGTIDVVITNYTSGKSDKNKNKLFYEWPLSEIEIKDITNKLLEIKLNLE